MNSKQRVRNLDPNAKIAEEPYYADFPDTGGTRWYVTLSGGVRCHWGRSSGKAWDQALRHMISPDYRPPPKGTPTAPPAAVKKAAHDLGLDPAEKYHDRDTD